MPWQGLLFHLVFPSASVITAHITEGSSSLYNMHIGGMMYLHPLLPVYLQTAVHDGWGQAAMGGPFDATSSILSGAGWEEGGIPGSVPSPASASEDLMNASAQLPVAAPSNAQAALRRASVPGQGSNSSAHMSSQSLSDHAPLFLSHLEQRPAPGQEFRPESVVQVSSLSPIKSCSC